MKIIIISSLTTKLGKKFKDRLLELHCQLFDTQAALIRDLNGRTSFERPESIDFVFFKGCSALLLVDDDQTECQGFLTFSLRKGAHDKWCDIYNLYVVPELRGAGHGKDLLSHVNAYAKSKGCRFATLNVIDSNTNALNIYKNAGFHTEFQDMVAEL